MFYAFGIFSRGQATWELWKPSKICDCLIVCSPKSTVKSLKHYIENFYQVSSKIWCGLPVYRYAIITNVTIMSLYLTRDYSAVTLFNSLIVSRKWLNILFIVVDVCAGRSSVITWFAIWSHNVGGDVQHTFTFSKSLLFSCTAPLIFISENTRTCDVHMKVSCVAEHNWWW